MAEKLSSFGKAFKEARAEGKKTFTFNGKSYGTVTADDEQKRIDKLGSVSRQSGPPTTTQGATYPKPTAPTPKPKADEKSLLETYRESDMAKGFRDARATFGDTPSTDMLMKAGQVGIGMEIGKLLGPAGSAVGAAAKYLSKPTGLRIKKPNFSGTKDSPAASAADDIKEPPFNPEKMVDSSRSEPAFNLEKMAGRERPEPNFKKGGKVSASSRGDGIAQRGKTKGRMC